MYVYMYTYMYKHILGFIALLYNADGLVFTRQDMLRVKLSRLNKFDVIGKDACCKKINQWKLENKEDREYRILLDEGIRQICSDNVFPLFVNETNSEYIIINLVSENNVNVMNILANNDNTLPIDKSLVEYHTFLVENDYNPSYYELKTNNKIQFLSVIFLNLLDVSENKKIILKKNDYMDYLQEDTRNRHRREKKGNVTGDDNGDVTGVVTGVVTDTDIVTGRGNGKGNYTGKYWY